MKKGKLKKILGTTALGLCALAMPFGLTACNDQKVNNDSGFVLRTYNGYVQWQREGDGDGWFNFESVDELSKRLSDTREISGSIGADAYELRRTDTNVQWRIQGEDKWIDLFSIFDGKEVIGETVNICYHLNGGINPVENASVKYFDNSNMIDLKIPTKLGCGFVGWYTDEECNNVFNGVCEKDLREDNTVCLYAKWTTDYITEGSKFISLNNKEIKTIIVPNGITDICGSAFKNCVNLEEITIPNSVKKIGYDAFNGCTGLKKTNYIGNIAGWAQLSFSQLACSPIYYSRNLYINNVLCTEINEEDLQGIKEFGYHAFANCDSLESVSIPYNIKAIDSGAFVNCKNLNNVNINYGVEVIGHSFNGCVNLNNIHIPESVNIISGSSFRDCINLNFISVAADNPTYDSRDNCNAIIETATNNLIVGCNNTNIPNNVTRIGSYAFSGSALEEIEIPNSVTEIGYYAFHMCESLKSITIPSSVILIDEGAFSYCSSLESVHIPSSVANIRYHAFYASNILNTVIIDSPTIANQLTIENDYCGYLVDEATIIYIKTGLNVSVSTYLLNNFTKQDTSDKDGYDMYVL